MKVFNHNKSRQSLKQLIFNEINKKANKKDKKLKIVWETRTPQNTEGVRGLDGLSVPAQLVTPGVIHMLKTMCQIILCDIAWTTKGRMQAVSEVTCTTDISQWLTKIWWLP
jgi:hypothetical protein